MSRAATAPSESEAETDSAAGTTRVLVVTGLGHKNELHYGPLVDAAGSVTLVCLDPTTDLEGADHVRVPEVGPRPLRLLVLFALALYEGYRGEYDAVASISLLPYGLIALALKALYGYPAHLGIIGIDLDHHAERWYGAAPRWAFRRFDVVSVPGPSHARALEDCGVPPDRIARLTNAVDVETYAPPESAVETDYEFVWIGRFTPEKDPRRFVEALEALAARDRPFRAAMVGEGPLREDVVDAIRDAGLEGRVDLPGWVDDPLEYYRRSATFVLTSRRDALPLVMVEAMASETACVVPAVGSIPDVVTDGEDGLVVPDRDPETFADAMERLLERPDERRRLAINATAIRDEFSLERAGEDWTTILATLAD